MRPISSFCNPHISSRTPSAVLFVMENAVMFQTSTNPMLTPRRSCSLRVARTVEAVSHATATMHSLQESFQGQTRESLARQDAALWQVLGQLRQMQTGRKEQVGERDTYQSSCSRCKFLCDRVQTLRKRSCQRLTGR
jgi:uncharacterized membrane protein YccC